MYISKVKLLCLPSGELGQSAPTVLNVTLYYLKKEVTNWQSICENYSIDPTRISRKKRNECKNKSRISVSRDDNSSFLRNKRHQSSQSTSFG